MLCMEITCAKNISAYSGESISFRQARCITISGTLSTIAKIQEYSDYVDSGRSMTKCIVILAQGLNGGGSSM